MPISLNGDGVISGVSTLTNPSEITVGTGASVFSPASNTLALGTNDSERLRITSTGNVQIANGNLVFSTSGTGIDFSATADGSGTTTSELLDDYEEGTWTAALGDDSNTTGSATGKYTKIGDVVFLTISIGNINTGTLTGSEDLRVTGLPFAPVETNFRGAGTVSLDNVSFSGYVTTEISGGSYLKFVENSSGAGGDRIIVSEYTSGSADLWISLSYKTSA